MSYIKKWTAKISLYVVMEWFMECVDENVSNADAHSVTRTQRCS